MTLQELTHESIHDEYPTLTPGEDNLLSLYGLRLVRLNRWAVYARPARDTDNRSMIVFDRTTPLENWIKLAKDLGL
jgi:hypothetical protein